MEKSKVFGEEHFLDSEMITLGFINKEVEQSYINGIIDKMQSIIHIQMPEIEVDERKLRKWLILCMNLENIEKSDLIDIATKKKITDLKTEIAEKDKEIEKYKKALEVCVRFYIGFEEATLKDQVSWRETRVKENCEYFIKKAIDQIEGEKEC